MVLFLVIVAANTMFLVYWTFKMYEDIKSKVRQWFPKIYIAVCLCYDHRKYKQELEQERINLENAENREAFLKSKIILSLIFGILGLHAIKEL